MGVDRDKLSITMNSVLEVIEKSIALDGVDKAKENLELLNSLFATEPGWAETKRAADKLMISNIKKDKKVKRKEKLEELEASRPRVNIKVEAEACSHQGRINNKIAQMVGLVKDNARALVIKGQFNKRKRNN